MEVRWEARCRRVGTVVFLDQLGIHTNPCGEFAVENVHDDGDGGGDGHQCVFACDGGQLGDVCDSLVLLILDLESWSVLCQIRLCWLGWC